MKSINIIRRFFASPPYSATRTIGAHEEILYVSGQLGRNPKTGDFVGSDVASQFKQAMENLSNALSASNYSLDDVKKTTIFMTDLSQFDTVNQLYVPYFKGELPARSAVVVKALPLNGLVEIEAIASKAK